MSSKAEDKSPPVQIGDVVELEIISMGRKGDGVAKYDGYIIFVPGAKRGERVKVEINQVLESFGFGILI